MHQVADIATSINPAGFSAMTGATREECLGANCRFLQQRYMGLRGRASEARQHVRGEAKRGTAAFLEGHL